MATKPKPKKRQIQFEWRLINGELIKVTVCPPSRAKKSASLNSHTGSCKTKKFGS